MMNDPWIRRHSRAQVWTICAIVLLAIFLLAAIEIMFIPSFDVSWHAISSVLNFGFPFVILVPALLLERKALKYRLRQHLKLLAGNPSVLVKKQPVPNRYALVPPLAIALRRKWIITGLLYGLIAFIALLCAGGAVWLFIAFFMATYDTGYYLLLAVFASGMTFFFLGLFIWFLCFLSRFWVKVTEGGLEARFRGCKTRIAWSEARFFCVDGVIGLEQQRIYTLAGEKQSVSWMQMMTENGVGLYRAGLPFELYQQQSQALLEVVAGQTRLPLYDMRLPDDVRSLRHKRS